MVGGSADVVSGAFEHTVNMQVKGQRLRAFVLQGRAPQIVLGINPKTMPGFKNVAELKARSETAEFEAESNDFIEASLVKALEERGIGRPSTYASIIGVLFERGYVTKRGTALVPGWTAFAVIALLERFYTDFVEYDFTAELENDLDRISVGELKGTDYLQHWYFGTGEHAGLVNTCVDWKATIDAREANSFPLGDGIVVRSGKFGPYLEIQTGEDEKRNVSVPDGLAPDELTLEKARELRDAPEPGSRAIGVSADGTNMITARVGRFGGYIQESPIDPEILEGNEPVYTLPEYTPRKIKGKDPKPRTASLFSTMDPTAVDLDSIAIGETMAVTFVIGNSQRLSASLFSPGTTIASTLANEFGEAADFHLSTLFALGFLLFVITFIVLSAAKIMLIRAEKAKGTKT